MVMKMMMRVMMMKIILVVVMMMLHCAVYDGALSKNSLGFLHQLFLLFPDHFLSLLFPSFLAVFVLSTHTILSSFAPFF